MAPKFYSPLLLLISAYLFTTCSSVVPAEDQPYFISGQIDSLVEDGLVILSSFDPVTQTRTPIDTASLTSKGTYELEFELTEPDLFQVNFFKKQSLMLVIAEGQRAIRLDVEGVKKGKIKHLTGSEDAEKLLGYENFRQASFDRVVKPTYDAMRAATKEGDQQGEIEAVEAYAKASGESRRELIDYTMKNIGTSIALYGSMLRWTGDEEIDKLEKLVTDFRAAHPDLKMAQVMADKVARFKKVALNAPAPEITTTDTSGTELNLSDIKGTYTLIDFWASWCGPCLLQVPDLKEAYDEFHDIGFEIVSVSVDSKADKWKKAIRDYEMNWLHLSDVKGWGSEPATDYNVTFIPFNVLLDKDGNIIAKNLHSKSLQGKLKELFELL